MKADIDDLSKCELLKIPDGCYLMLKGVSITTCDLSSNSLKRIPSKFFSKFPLLEELNLQGNKLSSLPEEIRDLEELERLDLTSNIFDTFPLPVCDCPKLKNLSLRDNKITDLEVSRLNSMSALVELDIQDNPLSADTQTALSDMDWFTVHLGESDPVGKSLDKLD
ncbi:leucine-rich repeat and death domain-containing protein 1-like [Dreissena polymorpha]|uniref:leucine-rich repeat and death domain-containing protein 1-like n=1 Tax=Dreissena polymorpha TaxID=45954 RepID=UPI00226530DE|nr:leucine-rich repeat and death domain-containing protein 1-like [Dreissena polymorpha]